MSYAARLGLLAAATVAAAALQVTLGTQASPLEALSALARGTADPIVGAIVFDVRVPRVLIALAAGACLGTSGLLLQVVLRNPLAAPEITGVASGAVLGAVAALSLGIVEGTAPAGMIVAATLGGLAGAGLLWVVAGRSRAQPSALAVLGVVVAAALSGVTALLITLDPSRLGGALRWLIGSINARAWPHWQLLWPWALAWIAAAWGLAAVLTVLLTGDDQAFSLGLRPARARLLVLGVAVAVASGAVAVVGAVAFVGLLVPHAAWVLAGADLRRTVPAAVLGGAATLSAADALAQGLTRYGPAAGLGEQFAVPVGAVTALAAGSRCSRSRGAAPARPRRRQSPAVLAAVAGGEHGRERRRSASHRRSRWRTPAWASVAGWSWTASL